MRKILFLFLMVLFLDQGYAFAELRVFSLRYYAETSSEGSHGSVSVKAADSYSTDKLIAFWNWAGDHNHLVGTHSSQYQSLRTALENRCVEGERTRVDTDEQARWNPGRGQRHVWYARCTIENSELPLEYQTLAFSSIRYFTLEYRTWTSSTNSQTQVSARTADKNLPNWGWAGGKHVGKWEEGGWSTGPHRISAPAKNRNLDLFKAALNDRCVDELPTRHSGSDHKTGDYYQEYYYSNCTVEENLLPLEYQSLEYKRMART